MKAIINGTLYTMTREPFEGMILVDHGKIIKIGANFDVPAEAEIIDAKGQLVFPGFVDAHCHLGLWEDAIGFEGADGNEATHPITPHMRAIDGINPMDRTFEEARMGGVTTAVSGPGSANVIGGTFTAIKTAGKRIDDMILKETIAMKIAFGENPKRVYSEKKTSPSTRMAIAAELRNALHQAKEYARKLEEAKEDPSKKPSYDIKMEALLPVVRKEIPLKAHAHRADDIFTALRIAKEFDFDITLDHCTEGHLIASELAGEQKGIIVGPSFGDRSKFELKNLTFETPGVLHEAGNKIAIMTDAPVVPLQYLGMCAALSVKSGLDKTEGYKAITINAAEITGIADRVGSLEPGKDADIVLWNKDPFDLSAEVNMTMINGEVVYQK